MTDFRPFRAWINDVPCWGASNGCNLTIYYDDDGNVICADYIGADGWVDLTPIEIESFDPRGIWDYLHR